MSRSHLPPEEPRPEGAAAPQSEAKEEKNAKKSLGPGGDLYAWLQAMASALVVLLLVFTFVGRLIGVDGHSMDPTLNNHDMLLLQSIAYEPKQGDVVVLRKDFGDISGPIVKRVIAVGGQTVSIDYGTGTVYVDGEPLDEPYINEPMKLPTSPNSQDTLWDVPEGCVFVMGDNRNASSDSRDYRLGPVDTRYILGKALCIVLPFQHMGVIS